ncbi:MAG: ATP-dependent Clp protease ATP-binding subunit [Candidatus Melainabacteria bacterium]|nr:ATP-dependent Clp protease ATP-binding subunit [Candidatus Melainabacteria bacterium]
MAERFTQSALDALEFAKKSAERRGRSNVDTDDIVYGIVLERTSAAARAILAFISDYRKVEVAISPPADSASSSIGKYRPGSEARVELGAFSKQALQQASNMAKQQGRELIGAEHILLGVLSDPTNSGSKLLVRLGVDLSKLRAKASEMADNTVSNNHSKGAAVRTPALDSYTVNLTEQARQGKLRPVHGRDAEIVRMIDILGLLQKNNPVIVGEAGVGKTALLEGLAQRIVAGNVPKPLRNKELRTLDIGALVAGTKFRGEFEERVKGVIAEVIKTGNILLAIDEIHAVMGAGSSEGSVDMSSMLKTPLSRGELSLIGTTTLDEYRKRIEKDPALARRFQPVVIEAPTSEQTLEILRALKDSYEKHHGVVIQDEALALAVKLSDRYISDRFHPDKDLDIIDQAGSHLRMGVVDGADEAPLVLDEAAVAETVSRITGVPASKLTQSEKEKLLHLEDILHQGIIGQDAAVTSVAKAMRRSGANLRRSSKPIASFIFAGPTGVGKTWLAKLLAKFMFGSEENMIRLDMSEYMERHTVSKLIGSPPGYVGYDEGGQLTNAVRRRPYSVVLFDEIEKAHPDVFNTLLQLLDDGRLTDAQGRTVDFKNTIIIMTTNVGSLAIMGKAESSGLGFDLGKPDEKAVAEKQYEVIKAKVMAALQQYFRPEFLNRLSEIIVFSQLLKSEVYQIIDLLLADLVTVVAEEYGFTLTLSASARNVLIERGYSVKFGAREMQRAITDLLEDPLSVELLKAESGSGGTIFVDGEPGVGGAEGKLVFTYNAAS